MLYKKLGNTDMNVSILAFGASVFNNFFLDSKFNNTEESYNNVREIIKTAIENGINYFDVAPWYGNAQNLLSIGLKDHPRSSYYLATKVGRYNSDKSPEHWFNFSYNRTLESVEESLRIFNTDYLDLVQVHDFEFAEDINQILKETLTALDELRKKGKIKYIGINSYSIEKIRELLEVSNIKIDTILTYTHLTLDDSSLLDHIDYFKKKGVGILNSAPLSMGLYTESGAPNWHRAPDEVKQAVRSAFDLCKKKNISLTKLAINFSVIGNLSSVDTTVVSMSSKEIVLNNISYLNELTEEEKATLNEIREKIFKPLDYKGFGDQEVESYKRKIAKNKN